MNFLSTFIKITRKFGRVRYGYESRFILTNIIVCLIELFLNLNGQIRWNGAGHQIVDHSIYQ